MISEPRERRGERTGGSSGDKVSLKKNAIRMKHPVSVENSEHALEDGDQLGVQVNCTHVRCWKEHGRKSSLQIFSSNL